MNIEYFGTELNNKGHYLWEIWRDVLNRSRRQLCNLPFNPEGLPYRKPKNGDVGFYQIAGFSVLAITGSCSDSRPGSKSVFFVESIMKYSDMKEIILSTDYSVKMINQMPFEVNWI